MSPTPAPTRSARLRPLLLWLVLAAATLAASLYLQRRALLAELADESAALHRLASQRADQHDAHLTALSAVAVADGNPRPDLFLEVAATIVRFYPRISAVDLVPLDGGPTATTRPSDDAAVDAAVRGPAPGRWRCCRRRRRGATFWSSAAPTVTPRAMACRLISTRRR